MEKRARGCLRVLTGTMMGYARLGDVDGLRAYLSSDAFVDLFMGVAPGRRQTVLRSYSKAEVLCEAKARHPLVHAKPIDMGRVQKTDWSDPARRAKLSEAYEVAGGDHEKAARILGVTPGSARHAKKRYLDISPGSQDTS